MARPKANIDAAEVERLAGLGLTQAEICLCLGINDSTLYRQKRVLPVLQEAIEKGRASAATAVSNQLFNLCKRGNLGAIIWYEKTRRGLSDRQEVNVKNDAAAIAARVLAELREGYPELPEDELRKLVAAKIPGGEKWQM